VRPAKERSHRGPKVIDRLARSTRFSEASESQYKHYGRNSREENAGQLSPRASMIKFAARVLLPSVRLGLLSKKIAEQPLANAALHVEP
jgi:hypothetical protein